MLVLDLGAWTLDLLWVTCFLHPCILFNMTYFPVLWLTGNTGAGKTTLAQGLERHFNEELSLENPLARRCIVLDGDDMRATISLGATLSAEDRRQHNLRVARLAEHLRSRGFFVVVAVIAPFASLRAEVESICNPVWVYIKRSGLEHADKPYDIPEAPDFIIDHDQLGIDDAQTILRSFIAGRLLASDTMEKTVLQH
jgi:adenylylsulfate kinase-like enzyme